MPAVDKDFSGSIPVLYETHLVPLIFQPYADDMAGRVCPRPGSAVLEVAAGTGVLTRALAASLDPGVSIVATDLNEAMLQVASSVGTARPVEWRPADATSLPFADASFDAVVCQFGAMFFPDKPAAFAEARRVLKPDGILAFSVWDRIEDNELADTITQALGSMFPHDPPRFLARTPHGYHDPAVIERDLAAGGFPPGPRFETVALRSRARSARAVAIAYCHGTPLRSEIQTRDPDGLDRATGTSAEAIARRFGPRDIDAKMQAIVVTVKKESLRPASA